MVFTETWLHPDIVSSLVWAGFSGKGGGVSIFVYWCSRSTVRAMVCNPDIELLCLSLKRFHLCREFGNIILCAAYVPPSVNATMLHN